MIDLLKMSGTAASLVVAGIAFGMATGAVCLALLAVALVTVAGDAYQVLRQRSHAE
jgi:hypothetical protein